MTLSTFKSQHKRKIQRRQRREMSFSYRIKGTKERPRLAIFRSLKNIYAQIIDDEAGVTLTSASSVDKELKGKIKHGGNVESGKVVAELLAGRLKEKGIDKVVFDKGWYKYHGRVKVFTDVLRSQGIKF